MKITIESTSKVVKLNGYDARIWEGNTESGIKIHCYITLLAIDKEEERKEEFEIELEKHNPPTPEIQAIPISLII